MTTLYLVRHGETVDNVNQILQGQTGGALTPQGIRQAEEVKERMRHLDIDAFVSSDLKRAYDTCAIIAEPHDKKIETTLLLRERNWGGFTGAYIPDLKGKEFPADVETLEAMLRRAKEFIEYVRTRYPDKVVLAVGHGLINRAIQSIFYGKPMHEVEKMNNAEVRTLDIRS